MEPPKKWFHLLEESKPKPSPQNLGVSKPPVTVQYNSLPSASKAYPAAEGRVDDEDSRDTSKM